MNARGPSRGRADENAPAAVRVVSYNILYGGQDRVEKIAEVLSHLQADIVGLQEANEPANVERLAERLGFHRRLVKSRRSPFHVALLSRWPIERWEDLGERCPDIQRAALRATIAPFGERWQVVVLHLSPGSKPENEAARLRELDALLPVIGSPDTLGEPALMMGDFNSRAPLPPPAGSTVPAFYEVARRVAAAGWTDAIARVHGDCPRHSLTTDAPTVRVDYLWLSPALAARLVAADVEQGDEARAASDHFPVWADVRRAETPGDRTAPPPARGRGGGGRGA